MLRKREVLNQRKVLREREEGGWVLRETRAAQREILRERRPEKERR